MSVFEDGRATTCPDCGNLEYQNRQAIVCLSCDANYRNALQKQIVGQVELSL